MGRTFVQNLGVILAIAITMSMFVAYYLIQVANTTCTDVANSEQSTKNFYKNLIYSLVFLMVAFFLSYGYLNYNRHQSA